MSLDELRKEIDQIDSQMLELFLKRISLADSITQQKIKENLPVFSPGRENEILKSVLQNAPSQFSGYATSYISCLMDLSKNRQRELIRAAGLNQKNPFIKLLSLRTSEEKKEPEVIVQGRHGSFSSAAARQMYPDGKTQYVERWDEVFSEISGGNADYGVLPLENSLAGSVAEVYDLLFRNHLFVVKATSLKVSHCLLGVRGANINDIRQVYSHPHAFPQCAGFFEEHHKLEKLPALNTATAAETVAREGNRHKAALASKDCAHLYGLDVLCENIEDNHNSCTRFISVSKSCEIPDDANKIGIIFALPHVTGSLYRLLARFALNGFNITKIESRPNHAKPFEYYFYLELMGSIKNRNTINVLASLSEELPFFYFLGNYSEQLP